MKKTAYINIILLFLVLPANIFAQGIAMRQADKYYENLAYSKAIGIYENILRKDTSNVHVLQRLADSFYQMNDYDGAFKYYDRLSKIDQSNATFLYRYGQLLIGRGRFFEASGWLKKYLETTPNDRRAKIQLDKLGQIEDMKAKAATFEVHIMDGNSRFIDMCPVYYNDRLVFASSRDSFSVSMKKHEWNDQPFLDLYITSAENNLIHARKFSDKLNTPYHEGPVCFTKDGNTAYFTRNNFIGGKVAKTPQGVNNLKLLVATKDDKGWGQITEFPYNSNEYSLGHAALSPDEKTIYYASNMPGSYGKTDIYKSELVNGQWSQPVNMGPSVNTEGKEMFPYVASDGVLYLASDGLAGLGGLDIYAAIENEDGTYMLVNSGSPVNSSYDDFGYIIDAENTSGYFTSNRPGGVGDDDIYQFRIESMILDIVTYFENTGEILPQTTVSLKTCDGEMVETKITNGDGQTSFVVKPGQCYLLTGEKESYLGTSKEIKPEMGLFGKNAKELLYLKQEQQQMLLTVNVIDKATSVLIPEAVVDISSGTNKQTVDCNDGSTKFVPDVNSNYGFYASAKGYFGNSASFSTINKPVGKYEVTIGLEKIEQGKTFVLRDIYYDLDKWNIRPDAAIELNKVVKVLKENPEVKVELSSHTDCRASNAYNNRLSQHRAESAVNYLVENGIDRKRLVAKGYGETRLVNHCADGVHCSEEEHQANRRTELKVLENSEKSESHSDSPVNKSGKESVKGKGISDIKNDETLGSKKNNSIDTNTDNIKAGNTTLIIEFSYYLIAGSFKSSKNADKFMSELTTNGYKPEKIVTTNNQYSIAVGNYNSWEEATKEQKKYLEADPKSGVWILKKQSN